MKRKKTNTEATLTTIIIWKETNTQKRIPHVRKSKCAKSKRILPKKNKKKCAWKTGVYLQHKTKKINFYGEEGLVAVKIVTQRQFDCPVVFRLPKWIPEIKWDTWSIATTLDQQWQKKEWIKDYILILVKNSFLKEPNMYFLQMKNNNKWE